MYVRMVITYTGSRVWINRVRLPILLVVSWTEKMNIPLSPCVPENLVSRDGFSRPVPRQPAHLHTQAESGRTRSLLYLRVSDILNLTSSRWTASLPSCLWSQRIFPSLPGSRLTIFYRDASSALLQLVTQWLDFTYSRSHAFRYERKNTNPTLVRIALTTSALAGVQVTD